MARPSHTKQLIGSILVAVILTIVVVAIVTAKIGPGLDAQELREREKIAEERRQTQQDRVDGSGGPGQG